MKGREKKKEREREREREVDGDINFAWSYCKQLNLDVRCHV